MGKAMLFVGAIALSLIALAGCRVEGEVDDDLTTPIVAPR